MTITQRKRGKSDKSPPILSHEFVRKNHGDIFAMIISAFIFGNVMQTTKAVFQPFIRPAHNVTSLKQELTFNVPIYSTGLKDFLLLITYICGAVVVTCIANEQIADRFLNRFHLSVTRSWKCRHALHQLCFSLPCFIFGIYTLYQETTLSTVFQSFTKYPQSPFSLCTKIFFMYAIGFQICMLMKIYLIKFRKELIAKSICIYVSRVAFVLYFYLMNMTKIGTIAVVAISGFELFLDLTKLVCILVLSHKSCKSIIRTCLFFFIAFISVLALTFVLHFIFFMASGSEFATFFEKQYPKVSTLSLRLIGVAVVVSEILSQVINFMSFWELCYPGVGLSLKSSKSSDGTRNSENEEEEDEERSELIIKKKESVPPKRKGSAVVVPKINPSFNKKKKDAPIKKVLKHKTNVVKSKK